MVFVQLTLGNEVKRNLVLPCQTNVPLHVCPLLQPEPYYAVKSSDHRSAPAAGATRVSCTIIRPFITHSQRQCTKTGEMSDMLD